MDLVTFTVIIDDIIYPDGHTCMASLGGGGPQTAFGAKIWVDDAINIGIASGIGSDFPLPCKRWLEDMRIDLSSLLMWSSPTLRAWQILELDGLRTQVWRITMGDEVLDMLRPPLSSLPMTYRNARVYHICVHPSGRDAGFIQELRSTGAEIVSVETYTHALDIVTRSELIKLVSSGNIFSSNEKEAASLVGPGSPVEMIERITELGAEVVTLRRGPFGSIVHRSDTQETWEIPAFHAICSSQNPSLQRENIIGRVVDPTGCGNTFCGAFAMGWWKTRDLLTAGLWGSVAASFNLLHNSSCWQWVTTYMALKTFTDKDKQSNCNNFSIIPYIVQSQLAEYEGVPPPQLSNWRKQAQMRLDMLRPYAKKLLLPM